jgi:uncharacterized protein YbbK (DUF523 family)
MSQRVLISACLLGAHTRYDGTARKNDSLLRRLQGKCLVPVCPEQLGGLPTPRPPAIFEGGTGDDVLLGDARLVNEQGRDVTQEYVRGAQEALRIAKAVGATEAYLKARSPACGRDQVYLGAKLCSGSGVCAALLRRNGLRIHTID